MQTHCAELSHHAINTARQVETQLQNTDKQPITNAAHTANVSAADQQAELLRKTISFLEADNDELMDELKQEKTQHAQAVQDLEALKQQLKQLAGQKIELSRSLKSEQRSTGEALQLIEGLRCQVGSLESRRSASESAIEQERSAHRSDVQKLEGMHQAMLEELEEERSRHRIDVQELEGMREVMVKHLGERDSEIAQLEAERAELCNAKEVAVRDLNSKEQLLISLKQQVSVACASIGEFSIVSAGQVEIELQWCHDRETWREAQV